MNEAEWMASNEPQVMLEWLLRDPRFGYGPPGSAPGIRSKRKLRLFAVACCRSVWHLLVDTRSQYAVEVAERYADGEATEEEREIAYSEAMECSHDSSEQISVMRVAYNACSASVAETIRELFSNLLGVSPIVSAVIQANLLRDVVGNPWRPIMVDPAWMTERVRSLSEAAYRECGKRRCETCGGCGSFGADEYSPAGDCWVCRGTGTVDNGTLDPARLAVLSDALEESGCPQMVECEVCKGQGSTSRRSADASWLPSFEYQLPCENCGSTGQIPHPLLAALRSPGSKFRGFWPLDAIREAKQHHE